MSLFGPKRKTVFIGYIRTEQALVKTLAKDLEEYNIATLWDKGTLSPGDIWEHTINGMINTADTMLALLPYETLSDQLLREVNLAKSLGKRIIPILRPGRYTGSPPDVIKLYGLQDHQWIVARRFGGTPYKYPTDENTFLKIVESIRRS